MLQERCLLLFQNDTLSGTVLQSSNGNAEKVSLHLKMINGQCLSFLHVVLSVDGCFRQGDYIIILIKGMSYRLESSCTEFNLSTTQDGPPTDYRVDYNGEF